MEASNPFTEQARLMIALLPQVAKQTCFALKGGTAINLFIVKIEVSPVLRGCVYRAEFEGMTYEPIST